MGLKLTGGTEMAIEISFAFFIISGFLLFRILLLYFAFFFIFLHFYFFAFLFVCIFFGRGTSKVFGALEK
jgi:hypothetical protein